MSELTLLVDRRQSRLSLDGTTLRLATPREEVRHVPLNLLGSVILIGNPQVELRVLRTLAERAIPVVVLPLRGAGEGAWIGSGLGASVAVRIAQHKAVDTPQGEVIARHLVAAKLEAYANLATELGLDGARDELVRQRQRLADAQGRQMLMGIEGAGASAWWRTLAAWLPPRWKFRGRNRRPPRDPLNALLSLGYTLLGAEMAVAVRAVGLDPALGFLHGILPGRETLVLDLMEPLRAGVDAWALELLTSDKLEPTDFFHTPATGCRVAKQARRRLFGSWAAARHHWPDPRHPQTALRHHCLHWARWLRQRLGPYDPFSGRPLDG